MTHTLESIVNMGDKEFDRVLCRTLGWTGVHPVDRMLDESWMGWRGQPPGTIETVPVPYFRKDFHALQLTEMELSSEMYGRFLHFLISLAGGVENGLRPILSADSKTRANALAAALLLPQF